jgi:hypothetical protein
MVVHSYNSSHLRDGNRNRRITVQGQPRPKISKALSQETGQVWWHKFVILATWKVEVEDCSLRLSLVKVRPFLKKKLKA